MTQLNIGIVGFGKIARDEHVPAIARNSAMKLCAVASRHGDGDGVPLYRTLAQMLDAHPELNAIVLSQPPMARFDAATAALAAGKHVFLEKPPGATLGEVRLLEKQARERGLTLFASWHSRWSDPVAEFRKWCAGKRIQRVEVRWMEDVRLWHPGQDWIWQPGGFGVFDPGINALAIVTEVVAEPIRVLNAVLQLPANRSTPIAVDIEMRTASDAPVMVKFDWRQSGEQTWEIEVHAEGGGAYLFKQGGDTASMASPGQESALAQEYGAMYAHFQALVVAGRSDVDLSPLELVSDACLLGKFEIIEPFID